MLPTGSGMQELIQRCAAPFLAERHNGRHESVAFLDVRNRLVDGYCCLIFDDDPVSPALVAKAARTPPGQRVFDIEYGNLEALERLGMNADRPTTPQPLGKWHEGEVLVTLQTALPGVPMKNIPGSALFSELSVGRTVGEVHEWWCELQRRFGVRRVTLAGSEYEDRVLEPLQRFCNAFLLTPQEERFLRRLYEERRVLEDVSLPLMVRHGDFCTANIMVSAQNLGVFDWEVPLTYETPLFDLFLFYASTRFPYAGRRRESSHFESFTAVYWEDNYLNRVMRDSIRRAAALFEVPLQSVGDLFLLSLLQLANMKYESLIVSHGGSPRDAIADHASSDDRKRAQWRSFDAPDKNAPFADIRDGVLGNLGVVVARGLPVF